MKDNKPVLLLTNQGGALPTLAELTAFFRAVTGHDPTPDDLARTSEKMKAHA